MLANSRRKVICQKENHCCFLFLDIILCREKKYAPDVQQSHDDPHQEPSRLSWHSASQTLDMVVWQRKGRMLNIMIVSPKDITYDEACNKASLLYNFVLNAILLCVRANEEMMTAICKSFFSFQQRKLFSSLNQKVLCHLLYNHGFNICH